MTNEDRAEVEKLIRAVSQDAYYAHHNLLDSAERLSLVDFQERIADKVRPTILAFFAARAAARA